MNFTKFLASKIFIVFTEHDGSNSNLAQRVKRANFPRCWHDKDQFQYFNDLTEWLLPEEKKIFF